MIEFFWNYVTMLVWIVISIISSIDFDRKSLIVWLATAVIIASQLQIMFV